ncbi:MULTISPECIES: peptidoglycan-binding domain-containing protein [Streptomyces]|uniref:Peptidoglycan-binding protein n=1 Tax=Streptomyces tauricus TaxID=68274 RepID=A0ABZ1JVF7_9ACTN|nr:MULTISPECIES: peptidoglycan-binding domain-containing protein [Streptomyces]UPZ33920.1 peptidoglycan-binding protein [Streptomyces sp. LRE541]
MRALTKALVSATAAVGIAAGGLATAGTAMAAPAPAQQQAVTGEIGTLAVNNLGLTTTQAKRWQCYLRDWNFNPGTIDGQLGTNSWKAAQRFFNYYGYNGDVALVVDGDVGPATIRALQRFLNARGYGLDVDGIAGPKTKDAFADFAAARSC